MATARGHVPALPAVALRAVLQLDVLPVHGEALVEAADLVEHAPAQQQAGAEHPVALDRSLGLLCQVVPGLGGLDVADQRAQRRTPHERAGDRREAPARALQGAIPLEQPRPRDAAALVRLGVGDERRGAAGRDAHVGVQDQGEAPGRGRDQRVLVAGERPRALVDVRTGAERARERGAAVGDVLAHERRHAVARQGRQACAQELALAVRDDGCDDVAHASASR